MPPVQDQESKKRCKLNDLEMEWMYKTLKTFDGPPYKWDEVWQKSQMKKHSGRVLFNAYRQYKEQYNITNLEQYQNFQREKSYGPMQAPVPLPPKQLPPRDVQDKILNAWKIMMPFIDSLYVLHNALMQSYLDPTSQLTRHQYIDLFEGMKKRLEHDSKKRLLRPKSFFELQDNPDSAMLKIKQEFGEDFDWSRVPNEPPVKTERSIELKHPKFAETVTGWIEEAEAEIIEEEKKQKKATLLVPDARLSNRKRKSVQNISNSREPKIPKVYERVVQQPLFDETWISSRRMGHVDLAKEFAVWQWKWILSSNPTPSISELNDEEWYNLVKSNGVRSVKPGSLVRKEFYAIAVPNMEKLLEYEPERPTVPKSVFELNLREPSRWAFITIFHATTKATFEGVASAVEFLQAKKFLSRDRSVKWWQDEYFREMKTQVKEKRSAAYFHTSDKDMLETFLSLGRDFLYSEHIRNTASKLQKK